MVFRVRHGLYMIFCCDVGLVEYGCLTLELCVVGAKLMAFYAASLLHPEPYNPEPNHCIQSLALVSLGFPSFVPVTASISS